MRTILRCALGAALLVAALRAADPDLRHADVFLRASGDALQFGNSRLTLEFDKAGAWTAMRAGDAAIHSGGSGPASDFRVDGTWMVEKHGARLLRHKAAWDDKASRATLALTYAVGAVSPEWSVLSESWRRRTEATPTPAKTAHEFELTVTYSLAPNSPGLERTARVTRTAGQNLLRSDSRRFEGFLFVLPGAAAGDPKDCTVDVPGPFFPASYIRPRTPYASLLNRFQSFHSAPDAGFGVFAVTNSALRTTLGTWMVTGGEVAYLSHISADASRITFLHHDLRTVRLFRRSSVASDTHHVRVETGGTPQLLAAYRDSIAARTPLATDTPKWAADMVVLEAMPAYYPGGLKGLTARLREYRDIGFNTLYVMPHYLGGYSPIDPFTVDPAAGSAAEMKELVRTAHSLGMRVLFDMVIHGLNAASPFVKSRPELFVRDELGYIVPHATWGSYSTDWASPAYHQFMREYVQHDIEQYGIDGYRVDAATYKSPNWDPGIPYEPFRSSAAHDLLTKMTAAMREKNPEAILLSEVFGPLYYSVSNSVHDNQTEAVPFLLERMGRGESDAEDYKLHLAHVFAALPAGANRVFYARNHDTSWFYRFGGYTPRFFAFEAVHAFFGIPEAFGGDPKNGPHPDSNPAIWSTYRKLFALRRDWPELTRGEVLLSEIDGGNRSVFTGARRGAGATAWIAVSFSDAPQTVRLTGPSAPPAVWRDVLTGAEVKAGGATLQLRPFQILAGRVETPNRTAATHVLP